MKKVVGISTQIQNNRDMKFNELFTNIVVEVEASKYFKTHLFSNRELNSKL